MKPAPSSSNAAILPLTIHSPDVGVNTLVIIFKIVDFPLPFLPMIGIPSDGGLASLMIALYLTQDSFGTAANVSGDNAIAAVVDHLNKKWSKKADNKVA